MHNLIQTYIKKFTEVKTVEEYDATMSTFVELLIKEQANAQIIQDIRSRGKYLKSVFSDSATMESMLKAKEDLLLYLMIVLRKKDGKECENLELYLKNFYLFLEAFRENAPDKRATISVDDLKKIKIENEYDLQHLLYAVLKPLYADIRKEVTDDSGIGAVRSDIKIPSLDAIIEAKCTRKSMQYKKLVEEMESDIVHYDTAYIFFYVYDKEKLIKDKTVFENYFNKTFDSKQVKVFVLQPVNL